MPTISASPTTVCHEGTPEEGVLRAAMLHKGESTDAEHKGGATRSAEAAVRNSHRC